jgi:FkbM family methyltransferase
MPMVLSRVRRALARTLWPDPTARLDEAIRDGLAALRAEMASHRHPARLIPPRELMALPRDAAERLARERVRPLYLGDHRAVSTMLARYKFFTDTRDIGFATHLLTDGYWEMWLTRFMAKIVREGMLVLDVGANFGYYSVLMADLVGPNGKLIAVEPNPSAAQAAEASLSVNGFQSRTTVIQAAASDTAGTATFCVPRTEPKNATIVPEGHTQADAEIFTVRTVTLDEVCRDQRVDFIKIDAEGGEYLIFNGMQIILRRDRPKMILEFNAARDNAAPLLQMVLEAYGSLKYLGFDSSVHDVSPERVMSEHFGEDWLLFLE